MSFADFEVLFFRSQEAGCFIGEAAFRLPSGDRRTASVYRDRDNGRIAFEAGQAIDAELFSLGGCWRELQCGLRAALLAVHPELEVEESSR